MNDEDELVVLLSVGDDVTTVCAVDEIAAGVFERVGRVDLLVVERHELKLEPKNLFAGTSLANRFLIISRK